MVGTKKDRRESGRKHVTGDREQGIPDEIFWDNWKDWRDGFRSGIHRDGTRLGETCRLSEDEMDTESPFCLKSVKMLRYREKQRRLERRRRLR